MTLASDIAGVLRKYPNLGSKGFGTEPNPISDDFPSQVAAAQRWFSGTCDARKLVERRGSYAIKHLIERAQGGYISNGAAITAAVLDGFAVVRTSAGPNCRFLRPGPR